MKYLKLSFIICCVILSLFAISLGQSKPHKDKIKNFPEKDESGYPLTYVSRFHREKPSDFGGKIAYWLRGTFGSNFVQIPHYKCFPTIEDMNLSDTVFYTNCETQDSDCSNETRKIEVSVKATDPVNDVLLYNYKVTDGKTIGYGPKIIWDLSELSTGTYSITFCADDGRGCEAESETNIQTKEVHIIESKK